jgi:hypothetical protein
METDPTNKSEKATSTHGESALVQPPIVRPDQLRMLRDWKFVGRTRGRSFKCTIRAGEIGEYFRHSYCFTFPARRGWVPYIPADKIMQNPDAWESLPNTSSANT